MRNGYEINRRDFLKGIGAVGAVTVIGGGLPTFTMAAGKTIIYQNQETDPKTVAYQNSVFQEFEKKTGVKVMMENVVPGDPAMQKILNGIKAGRSYDMVNVNLANYATYLAAEGYLVPLTKIIKDQGEDDFAPMTITKYKNEYYYYPYDFNFAATYYRKDWLEKENLAVPRTWDEFKTVAKRFTKEGHFGLMYPLVMSDVTNWAGTSILWSNEVHIFDKDWRVIFDSPQMKPKVIECLELLKELHQYMPKGVFQCTYADLTNSFTTGMVGISFYAGRLVHHLEQYAPNLAQQYIMTGFPTPNGKKLAVTHSVDVFAVLNTGQCTQESLELLRLLVNEKFIGFLHTLAVHFQPTRKSIYKDPVWRSNPLITKHAAAYEQMAAFLDPAKTIVNALEIDGPSIGIIQTKVCASHVIPEMYQNVLIKNMKPANAVEFAAGKIREITDKELKKS